MYDFANAVNKYEEYVLNLSLRVYGLDAEVYSPTEDTNLYGEVTYQEWDEPVAFIRVLFDISLVGLDQNEAVTTIDRYDQELILRTTYQLKERDKLVIKTKDGRTLNLKVVNPSRVSPDDTSVNYKYFVSVI